MKLKDYLIKNNITKIAFATKVGTNRMSLAKYITTPEITPLAIKLAIEYITAGEVRREDWGIEK